MNPLWGLATLIAPFLLLLTFVFPAAAQQTRDQIHLDLLKAEHEIDQSIGKGLKYLVSQQEPDGRFRGSIPSTYTALSCIALMAAGQMPGRSEYGENLRRGVAFLVRMGKTNRGYYGNEGKAKMYGHGIVTLALTEAYGMMPTEEENRDTKEAIERALKVILYSQTKKGNHRGGWRYQPRPGDADLSVTVWMILALRSAQNCHLEVPQEAIDLATDYVRRTYHKGRRGYAYQAGNGNATASMKTAGAVGLLALGSNEAEADKERTRISVDFLKDFDPKGGSHFYYQCYYVATAANMVSDELRKSFLPKLERTLINMQRDNGEWPKHSGHEGGVYATAFGVICLCVHYQYLPIYQE